MFGTGLNVNGKAELLIATCHLGYIPAVSPAFSSHWPCLCVCQAKSNNRMNWLTNHKEGTKPDTWNMYSSLSWRMFSHWRECAAEGSTITLFYPTPRGLRLVAERPPAWKESHPSSEARGLGSPALCSTHYVRPSVNHINYIIISSLVCKTGVMRIMSTQPGAGDARL